MNRTQMKVNAVNKANQAANELYDKLAPVYADFVGQQIIKLTGALTAKLTKKLPDLPNTDDLRVINHSGRYSVYYAVRACENDERGNIYHEVAVYIGELQSGVLTKLCDRPKHLRTDWTVEEVNAGRERINAAKEALSEAQSAIYPFGEYDR